MMKIVGYLRVSSKGQVDGDGQARQTQAVQEFCSRHGLECIKDFFEAGVSGTVDGLNRPQFVDMLDFIEAAGDVAGFVVERMDRLARDLIVSETLLAECRKRNVRVFCADRGELVNMAAECADPAQKFARQLFAAVAELEKSMQVMKLRVSRERIRAQGKRCEGAKPFGFYKGEKEVISTVMYLRGRDSCDLDEIASQLNNLGFRTRRGTLWNEDALDKAFKRYTAAQQRSAA
jgi:DNA invertase Pin-like site-specific DNA recombinase